MYACKCPDGMSARTGRKGVFCDCPLEKFSWDGIYCRYRDAPWNVTAIPLSNTAIKLTWSLPLNPEQGLMMNFIYYGIFPHGVNVWPVGATSSTTFLIGQLEERYTYVFEVSSGIRGHHSETVKSKPRSVPTTTTVSPQPTQGSSSLNFLLYIVGHEIRKLTLNDGVETTLIYWKGLRDSPPVSVDYHYNDHLIYWGDRYSIHRSPPFGGSGNESVETIYRTLPDVLTGLAVDWIGDSIYCISNTHIRVYSTDGRFRKTVASFSSSEPHDLFFHRNIALDPPNGYMYWLHKELRKYDRYPTTSDVYIYRASMLGSRKTLLHTASNNTQIAIDHVDQTLYWTSGPQIQRGHLDTGVLKTVFLTNLSDPASLSISGDYIYWVDRRTKSIQRANKTDGSSRRAIKTNVTQAKSLKVVNWDNYRDYDTCSFVGGHCSHFCLLDPVSVYHCECPDTMKAVKYSNGQVKCQCPSGKFFWDGLCRYMPTTPWNVTATALNNTAIKLTWLAPMILGSREKMYYIYSGIFPHPVNHWPVAGTTATTYVVSHLKEGQFYLFEIALGLNGRHSPYVKSKTKSAASPQPASASRCPVGWFHCQRLSAGTCIRLNSLCDGKVDCPQGWDEQPQNCPSTAPVQLKAIPFNSTAIIVSWLPPKKNPSGQKAYYIYCGPVTSGVSSAPVGSTTNTTFVVGNLQQRIIYVFEVSLGVSGQRSIPVNSKPKSGVSLKVKNVKAVPLVNSGRFSVRVSWQPISFKPPGVPYQGYRISYRTISLHHVAVSEDWHTVDTPSMNEETVSGLEPCSEYDFTVQVVVQGSPPGPNSDIVKSRTNTTQTSAPKKIQVVTKGSNGIQITWEKPANYCHLITNYKIFYKESTKLQFQFVETGNILTHVITGLTQGKNYIIKMLAITADGPGLVSGPRTVNIPVGERSPTVPVTNLTTTSVTETTVVLAWEPSVVPGYKVYQSGVGLLTTTDKHSYSVTSLQSKTAYSFTVKPYNKAGEGPGATIEVTTKGDVKQPVQSLRAVVVNSSSIVLLWEKPAHVTDPAVIKGYLITLSYRDDLGTVSTHYYNTTGTRRNYTFTYLPFSTTCRLEVRTRFSNNNILGIPVTVTTRTGPFSAPVDPLKLIVHPDSTVTLSWSAPRTIDLKNSLRFYRVYWYCLECNKQTFSQTVGRNTTSCLLQNLQRGRTYLFTVHADTTFGIGKNSTTSVTLSQNFGQVRSLRASVTSKNMITIQWDAPLNIDAKNIKYYVVRWCNWCSRNVTAERTQFETVVLAGYTYNISVRVVTSYGPGRPSQIQKTVPPLSLKVRFAHTSITGRYGGLEVNLSWTKPSSSEHLEYKVKWHCISGIGSCSWVPYHGWTLRIVNTTSIAILMGSYDTAYSFQVTVITSRGRGAPYLVSVYIPPLNGVPRNFTCDVAKDWRVLLCHWLPPTDVNPLDFNYYRLRYRGNNSSYYQYKTVYDLNQTSVNMNIAARTETRYTLMIQVQTRHGSGKWAQTTISTVRRTIIGPVTQLKVTFPHKNEPSQVLLSWKAPSTSSPVQWFQYEIIATCQDCDSQLLQTRKTANEQLLIKDGLQCGRTYHITIRALTDKGIGANNDVFVVIPSVYATVGNLKASLISKRSENGILVTWDPPTDFPNAVYSVLVTEESLVVTNVETRSTKYTFLTRPGVIRNHEFTFGISCQTACGFGQRSNVTIIYPGPLSIASFPPTPGPTRSSLTKTQETSVVGSLVITSTSKWYSLPQKSTAGANVPATMAPSPTIISSSPTIISSSTNPFSQTPRLIHRKERRSFPYWSIAVILAALILIIIVICIIRRYKQQTQRNRTLVNLPYYPQDFAENVGKEDEMPLLMGDLTDDEAPISA